jgi:hypothetical protein
VVHRQLWAGAGGDTPDFSLDAARGWVHRNWLITPGKEGTVVHSSTEPVDYDWSD